MTKDCAEAAVAGEPAVKLNISVVAQAPATRGVPVVQRTTQRFEVCKVDGFVFKRKRKLPPPSEPPAACPAVDDSQNAAPGEEFVVEEAGASRQASRRRREDVVVGKSPGGHADVAGGQPESPSGGPVGREEPAELVDQHAKAVNGAVDAVLARLPAQEASSLEERAAGLCRASGAVLLEESAATGADDVSRGLLADVAEGFKQVSARAMEERHVGCTLRQDEPFGMANFMHLVPRNDGGCRKAALRSRLKLLKEAKGKYDEIVRQVNALPGEAAQEQARLAGAHAETKARVIADGMERCKVLAEAHESARRDVSLQVEGILGVEAVAQVLVRRAESAGSALHTELHRKQFRHFVDVGSPAKLLKTLAATPPRTQSQQ